jgi:class 3 adenylate cyclase
MTASDLAFYRTIVAADIERSTASVNSTKAQFRRVLYELFEESLRVNGISEHQRDPLADRGDGILALIHVDQVPKVQLLSSVIPDLSRLLADHNSHHPDHRLRLRTVVHAGEVHYDGKGYFGESLDIAFRLLDAKKVKRKLRHTTAPLVLVVSDEIYQSVVRHRYVGLDEHAFGRRVHVRLKGQRQRHRGWIHIPDEVPIRPPPRDPQDPILTFAARSLRRK